MCSDDYVDYTELSKDAQIMFVYIERRIHGGMKEYFRVPKLEMQFWLSMSRTVVKNALRELKSKGYIVSKNPNSNLLKVGEQYKYKGFKEVEE